MEVKGLYINIVDKYILEQMIEQTFNWESIFYDWTTFLELKVR